MAPRRRRLAASSTTIQRTGWLLPPVAAFVAISTIVQMSSRDTGRSGSSRRMARVVRIASKRSTAPTLRVRGGQGSVQLAAGAEAAPVLDDLPVGHPPHLAVVDHDLAPGGGHPERLAHVSHPAAAAVDDEVALGDDRALEPLEELEPGEEAVLAGGGVGEVALPRVRPVAVVEALTDHVHVPAAGRPAVLEEALDHLLRRALAHLRPRATRCGGARRAPGRPAGWPSPRTPTACLRAAASPRPVRRRPARLRGGPRRSPPASGRPRGSGPRCGRRRAPWCRWPRGTPPPTPRHGPRRGGPRWHRRRSRWACPGGRGSPSRPARWRRPAPPRVRSRRGSRHRTTLT